MSSASSSQPSPTHSSTTKSHPRLRSRTSTLSFRLPPVLSSDKDQDTFPSSTKGSSDSITSSPNMESKVSTLPIHMINPIESNAYLQSTLTPSLPIDIVDISNSVAGPSRPHSTTIGRRGASKSISQTRPPLSISAGAHRALSYHPSSVSFTNPSSVGPSHHNGLTSANTMPNASVSPLQGPLLEQPNRRTGLKRRISTPNLDKRHLTLEPEEDTAVESTVSGAGEDGQKPTRKVESRARSTSTSIVLPDAIVVEPTIATSVPTPSIPLPQPTRYPSTSSQPSVPAPIIGSSSQSSSTLNSVLNVGESTMSRLVSWVRPKTSTYDRVSSDSDSEKGLDGSEEEAESSRDDDRESRFIQRSAQPSQKAVGRLWGLAVESNEDEGDYFSLPPTPPDEKEEELWDKTISASLPTPALSARSLSHSSSKPRHGTSETYGRHRASRLENINSSGGGWWWNVYTRVIGGEENGGGKTAEVLRELAWTVAALSGLFVISLGIVLFLISGMPITQLRHLPKSTTDLQLLSNEIKTYMQSSNVGWWHTILVLILLGCWKHAWSIPGSVVLNILVGTLLEPMSALLLLTVITACGSLGAYFLSRPLAPLIAVLFPKPLALVRAALAPQSVPQPIAHSVHHNHNHELNGNKADSDYITPLQVSSDPTAKPVGGAADKPNVWRRLLVMRAMGLVPWSGMNVACGVVGVDWKTFWLTTAAGSASWSYVTASVGNILSRLAVPATALNTAASIGDHDAATVTSAQGESLTSLLRDPSLIAKLIFLTILTLLPALLKRRTSSPSGTSVDAPVSSISSGNPTVTISAPSPPLTPPLSSSTSHPLTCMPMISIGRTNETVVGGSGIRTAGTDPSSPLVASLAKFAPVPQVFDLFSFGRTAVRQSGRLVGGVVGGVRVVSVAVQKLVPGLSS